MVRSYDDPRLVAVPARGPRAVPSLAVPTPASHRVIAWLRPDQVALARAVAEAAGLSFAAAGSPARGQATSIAGELGCPAIDDLRLAIATARLPAPDADASPDRASMVWMLDPGEFAASPGDDDTSALLAARERGVRVASLEPIPASALALGGPGLAGEEPPPARATDSIRLVPLARFAAAYRNAADIVQSLVPPRLLVHEAWATPVEGSLGARLFAAMDLVVALMGEPETIDAAYVGPKAGALHTLPGESLRDLHGDLTVNMRFADARAACLALSNQGGRFSRGTTIIGNAGRLRVFEDGFEWTDPAGQKLDESRPASRRRGSPPPDHAAATLADALSRLLEPGQPDAAPVNVESALVLSQTALLSARTGQAESPSSVRRMAGIA